MFIAAFLPVIWLSAIDEPLARIEQAPWFAAWPSIAVIFFELLVPAIYYWLAAPPPAGGAAAANGPSGEA